MKVEQFVRERSSQWDQFETLLRARHPNPEELRQMPRLFRDVCRDLNLAQERSYGTACIRRLNGLAIAGYHALYQTQQRMLSRIARFVLVGFPQLIRREARLFWLCASLFFGPFGLMIASAQIAPEWANSLVSGDQLSQIEEMYGNDRELGRDGSGDSDFQMFLFYIFNNVSIDFRTFAGGIVFGLGTIFFLLFNGLYMGAFTAHIHRMGFQDNFYSFTSGHSALELTALVISGMAGMKLAQAIVMPGRLRRLDALRLHGTIAIQLIYGAATMTFLAAIIEGFWSPRPLGLQLKYTVGTILWVMLAAYFLFAGRQRRRPLEGRVG